MKIDFSNKTTIVVGGSGIGLKVKEKFSSLGSDTFNLERRC